MTKQTYYQKINDLEFEYASFRDTARLAVPMIHAEMIAEDADEEIKNLKRLLQASVYFVRESGMFDSLATEIEEVLNDD